MVKNVHRFGFTNAIGTAFIVFGVLLVTSGVSACAYLVMTYAKDMFAITSPIPTVIVVAVLSVAISYVFMSIFSFSSDAILQSFLLDEELRFAGGSRPASMDKFADSLQRKGKNVCSRFACW